MPEPLEPLGGDPRRISDKDRDTRLVITLFEKPKPYIKSFSGNPRVHYLPMPTSYQSEAQRLSEDRKAQIMLYDLTLARAMTVLLKQEFPDQALGIRGTAFSLGENIFKPSSAKIEMEYRIKNLDRTLKEGSERDVGRTGITILDAAHPDIDPYFVSFMRAGSTRLRRELKNDPRAAYQIFPVLLAFDLNKLNREDLEPPREYNMYSISIPTSAEDQSSVILKAIIVDYPHIEDYDP